MNLSIYKTLPDCAKEIRKAVFTDEQGFQNEFDEIDQRAVHIVLFDEEQIPAATCRVFWDDAMESYVLGRLAVVKTHRGKNIGSVVVKEAEKYVQKKQGESLILHAQCRAADFYRKLGFVEFGDIDNDEGCPHTWMKKVIYE